MAAPTSNNEVTARRLTRLLTGSDGNGGLWGKVKDKISSSINALDVSSVGGAGKYISAISETDGKISATATTMDTTPTASSTNAVTSGGVKTALDGKLNTSGGAMTGAITRDLGSGVISDTNLLTVTGSTDGFKVDYGAATADAGVTKIYTTDDANAKISIGNYNSSYKEAIGITNGSAALSNTPTAPTAAAGTNTTQIATTAFVNTAISNSSKTDKLYANAGWGGAFRTSLAPGDTYFLQQRNCLFGIPASSVQVEYSTDGGTTWLDYGLTDAQKSYLFSQFNGNTIYCGKATHVWSGYTGGGTKDLTNDNIANQRLRITICNMPISQYGSGSVGNQWLYGNVRRFGIHISTQSTNASSTHCVFSGMKRENFTAGTNTWESFGDFNIRDDSGWNSIPCKNPSSEGSITFGANFDGQYAMLRFEIWATALSSSPATSQTGDISVSQIVAFSELLWKNESSNTYLAKYGYPCGVDSVTGVANFGSKLKFTDRKLAVSLSNTSTDTSFNGTADVTNIKVSGTLGVANGGTGQTSLSNVTVGKADYPTGFGLRPSSITWGTLTSANGYTYVTNWRTASAAEIAFAEKSGALYTQIDGVFYQREGGKRVLDVSDINSSFYAPTGAGTSGQILKSSGSGAPTWATANAALVGITVTSTSVSDGTTTFNKYTHPTSSGNKHVPTGGSSGQFLGWSADGTAAWVANPNTDTKVKATAKTDNVNYKILATASASPTSGNATEAVYDTDITLNPSTNTIAANVSGNAATATTADTATKLGTADKGSSTKPIYLSSGTAAECSTYAGGTAVTLNNVSKAASTASFYAPTTGGTANYVLIGNGATSAPTWAEKAPKATTADKASVLIGTYSGSGGALAPSAITHATVRAAMMNKPLGLTAFNTYCDCILMDTYNGNDVPYVTGFGISKNNGNPKMYIFNGAKGNTTTWAHELEVLTTASTIVASKISTSAKIGDTNKGVYVAADGTVTAMSYEVNKSVPSDAVFTDHTYNFSGTTFYSGNQSNAEHNADNIKYNGVYYWTSNGPTPSLGMTDKGNGTSDGAIFAQAYGTTWVGQIAQDYRNGNLFVRGLKDGTWQSWLRIPTASAKSVGNSTTPVYMAESGQLTALSYTIAKSVPSNAVFTDANVTQTNTDTSSNAQYRILMSATADDTTRTEGARKSTYAWFNPSTQTLGSQKFDIAGQCVLNYDTTTSAVYFTFS